MKQDQVSPYANARMIVSYTDDAPRKVPGLLDLHRMMMLLLAEQASSRAHILVIGAGGGLETRALAEAQLGWQLTGIDPSPAMRNLARQTIVPFSDRISLVEGTVDQAPAGPFDCATCLLTLHHIAPRAAAYVEGNTQSAKTWREHRHCGTLGTKSRFRTLDDAFCRVWQSS
jgi:tRNA (cmo5U34)-methyltransferase